MSADKSFRGTLLLLQNKTKRDPEAYADEFRTQLKHFEAVTKTILSGSGSLGTEASNPQFLAVMHFVSHVAYCYPEDCAELPELLIQLLRIGKESLTSETRLAIVNCLLLLRNKNVASAELTIPVLFELLEHRDKTLRKTILSHIVSDVRRINLPGAKAGSARVNKNIQNFLFKVMEDDDPVQARSALTVMIDLYRRQLWADERTVQVISKACFSKHTLVLRMAMHFFLMQMPKFTSVGSDSDSDDDPGRVISRLKHKLKHKAKTVKRERVLKTKVGKMKKRFDEDWRAEREHAKQLVDPIRFLQDPQGFAERLLSKLHKTTERFEVRLLMMSVLARTVNEHELVVLGVFPLFERYLEPTQLHATNILALASTCVHRMVPPDALEGFVRTIADRFVNDRSDKDSITIGINTIREICKRQPLAMNKDLLADLVEYKQRRGEHGVIMAARALLQLYREVNPELLPPKLRGSKSGAPGEVAAPRFGAEAPLRDIPGLEALFGPGEGDNDVANSDDLDSSSSSVIHITTDEDSDGDDWEMVSHDSDDDLQDSELDEDDNDADVPLLVPIKNSNSGPAAQDDAVSSDSGSSLDEGDAALPAPLQNLVEPDQSGFVAADDMWVDSDDEAVSRPSKSHRAERHSGAPLPLLNDSDGASDDEDGEAAASDEWEVADSSDEEDEAAEESDDVEDAESTDGSEEVSSSGSGEWVNVSQSDDDDDDDDNDEDDDMSIASHDSDDGDMWREDVAQAKKAIGSSVGASTAGKGSAATMRTLTDEEFAKLRQIQSGAPISGKLKSKQIEKRERMSKKDALVRDLGERGQLLDPSKIESFTDKKRERDRDGKIEEAQKKRLENNPFQARKKKKSKLNTTHREKSKVGKLYQMTKRSGRVAEKLKRSIEEKRDHAKDMKKKTIKFRIARGWKA